MRWSWLLVGLLALPVAGGCASTNSVPYDDTSAGGNAGSQGDAGSDSEGGKGGKGGSGTSGQAGDGSGVGGRAGEGGESGEGGAAGESAGSDNAGGAIAGGAAGAGGDPFGGSAGASAGASGQGGAGTTSAGGSSGAGGAGGAVGSSCAAAVTASVAPLQPLTISDDTSLSKNVFGAYCDPAGASGKDFVYKVVPSADGKIDLTLKPTSDAYDPVLSVTESECTVFVTSKDGGCTNFGGPGSGEARTVTAKAGQPFWVYVDGVKGNDGPFTLTAVYQGSGGSGGASGSSGQGGASGSGGAGGLAGAGGSGGAGGSSGSSGQSGAGGSSATGGASGAGGSAPTNLGATCATPITVSVGKGATEVNGSTAGTGSKGGAFYGVCNPKDGPDRVIEVTVQAAGQLTVKAEPLSDDYDLALFASKDVCDEFITSTEVGNDKAYCRELSGPGGSETLPTFAVTANQKVYVVVDTNSKNTVDGGPFRVTLTLQ